MKWECEVLSTVIGINLWFAPQISEHWPKNSPGRFIIRSVWFKRPGMASTLSPSDGRVQEWITSEAVINKRVWDFTGRVIRLSVSKRRGMPDKESSDGII